MVELPADEGSGEGVVKCEVKPRTQPGIVAQVILDVDPAGRAQTYWLNRLNYRSKVMNNNFT